MKSSLNSKKIGKKTKSKKKVTKKDIKNYPNMTSPKVDGINLLISSPDIKYFAGVYHNLQNLIEDGHPGVVKVHGYKEYKSVYHLHYPTEQNGVTSYEHCLKLYLTSTKSPNPKFQIRYNPFHLTQVGSTKIKGIGTKTIGEVKLDDFFDITVGMKFYEFLYHSRATSLDINMDIIDRDLDELLFFSKKSKQSQCVFGTDGLIGTLYFNQKKNNQTKVYNKSKEAGLAAKNITRVERTLKLKSCPIKKLYHLEDPFKHLEIISLKLVSPFGKAFDAAFLDSCRLRGVGGALKIQPASHRKILKKLLMDETVDWWRIDDWGDLLDYVLSASGFSHIPDWAPPLTYEYHYGVE